jgi:subtilisin family serine protease
MGYEKTQVGMKNLFYSKHSRTGVLAEAGSALSLLAIRLISAALICLLANVAAGQNVASVNLTNPDVRQQQVGHLAAESQQRKADAWQIAKNQGWIPKGQIGERIFELMAIERDRVYVYQTCNVNAAISIGANLIRNTFPYNLNGAGLTVGIWDSGAVRPTHREFGGRVVVMDGAGNANHSTHVGGTIGAVGIMANALGMAPSVLIDSYEWTGDVSEMTSRAMSYPNEPGKIQLSNHSYGYICGWEFGFSPPRWYGTWGERESDFFGIYSSYTAEWDILCYNAPYYLPFKGAGNDRDDNAPGKGNVFEYYKFPPGIWRTKSYNPSKDPYDDGWDNGGFDTIMMVGSAKNIMTVGALNDAVTGGARDITKGTMTSFSGWGPTDDGRIKPDIVTNGVGLFSSVAVSDSSYASYSGTSMSTPSAAGAAMLLVDYYGKLFPGQAMRASTLKALIIHTADDLGNPGPDYKFGWGLMNAKDAADQIKDHNDFPDANKIVEGLLDAVNTTDTYTFEWDASTPIRATLCWTDPPATEVTALDDPSPRLINDLDLRIVDPNGLTTYYPYVLNPAGPNDPATTGDNTLDNVEQILIQSPTIPGAYTVQISYKAALTNGQQYYSLILSGQSTVELLLADFNGDGFVNNQDLAILSSYWLSNEPLVDVAPLGGDGIVNFFDFAKLAQSWN